VNTGYGFEHLQLGKPTPPTLGVSVLWQQPVAFPVIGTLLAILAPGLRRLMLPVVLAIALVGPVIGISGQLGTLPLGFSRALAGLVGAETLRLNPGMRQHETSAMGTAHGAVHGFLLREAGHRKKRLSQEEEEPQPKKMRKEIHGREMREAGKKN
jgi:hypothetical protein